ncbi:MAG TPA: phospholipase [Vicinamibacteria bacterium]
MPASVLTVPARVHGRCLVEAPEGGGPFPLLVGFHGYGEAAEQHLEQLRRLPGAEGLVLAAVQSLHLFYRKDGAVVGSWMTREGREEAIADNIRYVADVVGRVRAGFPAGGPLVYAGFSQGAAMAYRAAVRAGHECHGLLVLGGDMPPDVADDASALPPVLIGRGRDDAWFTAEKLERDLEGLARRGARARSLVFEGGHEWTDAFLEAAGAFLREVARAQAPVA